MMKKDKINKLFLYLVIIPISLFLLWWAMNAYGGWYGYQKWKYRGGTTTISESKSRKVFVKTLHCKIVEAENLHDFKFTPYFERGFKFGLHTSEETNIVKNSQFPFNLSYDRNKKDSVALKILNIEKVDSSDGVWAYFKNPHMSDTIVIEIDGARNRKGKFISGKIKVW